MIRYILQEIKSINFRKSSGPILLGQVDDSLMILIEGGRLGVNFTEGWVKSIEILVKNEMFRFKSALAGSFSKREFITE